MRIRKAGRAKGPLWRCEKCDKASFNSRKAARNYIRSKYPGEHFSAYQCPHHEGYWHVGKLPKAVAQRGAKNYHRNPRKDP